MIPEKVFPGLSAMTLADLLKLPLVRGKHTFSHFSDKVSMKHYQACSYSIYFNIQN